jgi:hypothetical protein
MNVYVPETIDVSNLTHPDQIACLTDLIYTMPVYRRDCDAGLVPLNKTRLRQQFGQLGLDGAIEEATGRGIIYCDPSYSAGHRSKGYCIGLG